MKLICVDLENCGFSSTVENLKNPEHNNICPECFGLAIEASDNHSPLLYRLDEEAFPNEAILTIAAVYNILNQHDGDDDEGNED